MRRHSQDRHDMRSHSQDRRGMQRHSRDRHDMRHHIQVEQLDDEQWLSVLQRLLEHELKCIIINF